MSGVGQGGIERRKFLQLMGAVGAGVSLGGVWTACGEDSGGGGGSGGVLALGAADWLPPDWYQGNSLGGWLVGYVQMAWPLIIAGGGDGKSLDLQNGLASNYEVSPDARTHTVTLREGLKFHNGDPIDAEAVAANLRAAFFKDDPLRDKGSWIQVAITLGDPPIVKAVETPDELTVEIQLTELALDIRTALAFLPILNPKALRNKNYGTDLRTLRDAGSGPFRLTKWEPRSFAEFERFEGFFQDVKLERIRLQNIVDPGALALALRGSEIQVASGLAKNDFDTLAGGEFKPVVANPSYNVDLMLVKPDQVFYDKRVRKAMELAMNRQAYTDRFFNKGTAEVANQPIVSPGAGGYVPDLEPAPFDREGARALLAEAGVSSAKLTILSSEAVPPVSSARGLLEAIAEDLGAVGIDVELNIVDPVTASEEVYTANASLTSLGAQADPFIVIDVYYRVYGADPKTVLASVPAIKKDLDAAHKATSIEERDRLLESVIQTTVDDTIVIPISAVGISAVAASAVQDFPLTGSSIDSWNNVSIDA